MQSLRRFHDLYRGEAELDWPADLRYILPVALFVMLTGPLLFLAYALQDWCAGSIWDAEDRWRGTGALALTLLLAYLPLFLFRADIAHLWPHFFGPPTWHNLLLWWCGCVPLAPALALFSERVDPRTKPLERVLLPSEMPPSQPVPSAKQPSAASIADRKPAASEPDDRRTGKPGARRRKNACDPRPIYQAWAPQQLVLPQPSPEAVAKSSPASSARSARQARKDERDEEESLQDIF